jgi:hypothetical protein
MQVTIEDSYKCSFKKGLVSWALSMYQMVFDQKSLKFMESHLTKHLLYI